uniref:Transmembrane protein 116 n=1 Tax=Neolamprologus brichardi TaxID=32507 RepID=A0A3Q4GZM0_NEOBR
MLPVIIEGNISRCQWAFSTSRCLMMHTGALFLMSGEQPMSRSCLYLHTYHITVFLITVLVTLLSITVLVVKARCIYRRIVTSNGYLGSEQRASFGVMDRRMVLYPLVFVFCWGPGLFGADSDWFLLTTDAVSEVSACLCLRIFFGRLYVL